MIILSSIILLLFTVISTTRLAEGFSSTMLKKQEDYVLLQSGIAITHALISNPIEKNEDKKEEKTNKEEDKTKKIETDYFKLYWQKCNKWLDFTLTEKEHGRDGKIKVYLMIEDGKIPLQRILSEYNNQAKGNKNEENQTNDQSKTQFKNEHEQKTITEKKTTETKGNQRENLEKTDNLLEKSPFFKSLFKNFSLLEEKSQLFKELKLNQSAMSTPGMDNTLSFLKRCVMFHIAQKREGNLPLSLKDALVREDKIQNNVFSDNEEKKGIATVYSTDNKAISLMYASPELLEFFSGKKVNLTDESRKKILEKQNEFFKSGTNSEEKTWNILFSKTIDLPYPKQIIEDTEIKKLFTAKSDIPEVFSALIQITTLSGSMLALATFKKELSKTKKDSYEYLLKSLYIIPNT